MDGDDSPSPLTKRPSDGGCCPATKASTVASSMSCPWTQWPTFGRTSSRGGRSSARWNRRFRTHPSSLPRWTRWPRRGTISDAATVEKMTLRSSGSQTRRSRAPETPRPTHLAIVRVSRLRTRLNPKLARHTATGIDVQFSIFAELWAKEVGHTIAAPEITSSCRSDRHSPYYFIIQQSIVISIVIDFYLPQPRSDVRTSLIATGVGPALGAKRV